MMLRRNLLLATALMLTCGPAWAQSANVSTLPPAYTSGSKALSQTPSGGLRVQPQDGAGNDVSTTHPLPVEISGAAGDVDSSLVPQAGSGYATSTATSTAAEDCRVVKAASGNLYGLTVVVGATSGYVLVFNAAAAPSNGAVTPAWSFPVTSNGTNGGIAASWNDIPKAFATGITVCYSTTGPYTLTKSASASFIAEYK